ncbi:MAG TPA: hypothetical protein P5167_03680 [Bacteroidales bacterium]|nr:hypothetical protein [Bacteroidales bacterium]
MKKFFILFLPVTALLAVSCGSGYQVASSRYDDATYFKPDVTARVHLLATATEADELINQTIEQAGKEGARVETVYTNPDGVVNIDVEPGTTYLIADQNNDTYARKLKMFDDEDQDFCLTINMNFGYDYMWSDYYYWYSPWHRPRYWYRPYSYWAQWYWYPRSWYYDYWYNDWWYNSFYYPSWSYYSWMGPYSYWYPYGYYYSGHHHDNRHNNDSPYRENRRNDLRRVSPSNMVASNSTRSGGSYRRENPKIDQISGDRTTRTSVRDDVKNPVTEGRTTNYRRVTGTTNSEAVYRDPSTNTRSRNEQTTGNTFYRRSSNLSQTTNRENNRSSTTSSTVNPGNSRSFYRGNQSGSTRINNNSGNSRVTRSYGNSSSSRSNVSTQTRSTNRSSSSSSYSSGSRNTGSSGSMRSSGGSSGGGGSVSRSGSSGGSYRR